MEHSRSSLSEDSGPMTRGRKFSGPELYLMVLQLLSREPRHGYELAKELKAISQGFYTPSPGALYPVLGQMVQQGHAVVENEGKRKCYKLSASGHRHLQEQRHAVEPLFDKLRHAAKKMLWFSQATDPQAAAAATGWLPEFVAARTALRRALMARSDVDHAEQRRLVGILNKAVADIEAQATRTDPSASTR